MTRVCTVLLILRLQCALANIPLTTRTTSSLAWSRASESALRDCDPVASAQYFPPLERQGGQAMRVLSSDPRRDRSEMFDALQSAIDEAAHRVWLTFGYFVPDPRTVLIAFAPIMHISDQYWCKFFCISCL